MNKKDEISEQILKYLQKNPGSGDTLEGIARFWLKFEKIDQSVDDVRDALEMLIEKGVLRRNENSTGKTIYELVKKT